MQWSYIVILIHLRGLLQATPLAAQGRFTTPMSVDGTSASDSQQTSSHSANHREPSSVFKDLSRKRSTVIDQKGTFKLNNIDYESDNGRQYSDLDQKRGKRGHEDIKESAPLEGVDSRRQVNGTIYAPEWDQLTWSDNEEESQGNGPVDEGSGEAVELTPNPTHNNEVQMGPPKIAKEKEERKKGKPESKKESPRGNGVDHFLDIVSEVEEGSGSGRDELKKGIEAFKGRLERLIRLYHHLKGDSESNGSPVFADQKSTASDKHQVEQIQPSLDDLRRLVRILQAYPMYYRSAFKEGKSEEDMEPNIGGDTFEVWVDSKPKSSTTYDTNYNNNGFHLFDKRTKIPVHSKRSGQTSKNLSLSEESETSKRKMNTNEKTNQKPVGGRAKRSYDREKNLAEEMHDAAKAVHREIQRQSEASEESLKKIINQLKRHRTMTSKKLLAGNASYVADKKSDLRHPIRSLDNGLLYMSNSDKEGSDNDNDLMSLENQVEAKDAENLLAKKQATLEAAENALWSDDALIKRNDFRNFLVRNYINYLHHAGPILSDEVRTWGRIASDQSKELQHIHDVFQNYQRMDVANQQRWLGSPDLNLTPRNEESGMYGFMHFRQPARKPIVPADSALFEKIHNSVLDPSSDIFKADRPSFQEGSITSDEDESAAFRDSVVSPYGADKGKLTEEKTPHRTYVTSPPDENDYYQFSAPINDPASDQSPSHIQGLYDFQPVPVFQREIPEGYAFHGNDKQHPFLPQNFAGDSFGDRRPFSLSYELYTAMFGPHSDFGERDNFLGEEPEKDPARYTGTIPLVDQLQDEFRQFQTPKPVEFSHTESEVHDFPIPSKRSNILSAKLFSALKGIRNRNKNFLKTNDIDVSKQRQQVWNQNLNISDSEHKNHKYKKAIKHQTIIRVGLPSEEPGKKGELSQSVQPVSPEMSMLQDVDLARYSDSRDDGEFIRVLPRERFHNAVPLVAGRHISGGRNGPWVLNRMDTALRGLSYLDRIPPEAVAVLQGIKKRDDIPREPMETEYESKEQSQSTDRQSRETFLHSNEVRKRSKVTGHRKRGERAKPRIAKKSHRERREANLRVDGNNEIDSAHAHELLKTQDIMPNALPFVHGAELQDTAGGSKFDIPFGDSSDHLVIPRVEDSTAALEDGMFSRGGSDLVDAPQDFKNDAIMEESSEPGNQEIVQILKVPSESSEIVPSRSANNMTIGTEEKRGKVAKKRAKNLERDASSVRTIRKALPQVISKRSLAETSRIKHKVTSGRSHLQFPSSFVGSGDNMVHKTVGSAAEEINSAKLARAEQTRGVIASKEANAPLSSKLESSEISKLADATVEMRHHSSGPVLCRRSDIPDLKRLAQEVKGRTVRKVIKKIKDIRLTDNLSHEVVKFITGKLIREIDLPDFDLDQVSYAEVTTEPEKTQTDKSRIPNKDISKVTDFSENLGDAKRAFIPLGSLSRNKMTSNYKSGQRSSLAEQKFDVSKSDILLKSLDPLDKEFEDALYEDPPSAFPSTKQKSVAPVGKRGGEKVKKRVGAKKSRKQWRSVKGLNGKINAKKHKNMHKNRKTKSRKYLHGSMMRSSKSHLSPSMLGKKGMTSSNNQRIVTYPLLLFPQNIAVSTASHVIKGKQAVHTRSHIFPFPLHVHRFPVRNTLHGFLFPGRRLHHNSLLRRKSDSVRLRSKEMQFRNTVNPMMHHLQEKMAPREAVELLSEIQGPSVFQSTNLRTGKLDLDAVKKMRTGKIESLVPSLMIKSAIEGTTEDYRQAAEYRAEGARKDQGESLGSATERLPWEKRKEVAQPKKKEAENKQKPAFQPPFEAKNVTANSSSISSLTPPKHLPKPHLDAKLREDSPLESKKTRLKGNQTNSLTKTNRKTGNHIILQQHITPDRIPSQDQGSRNAGGVAMSTQQIMQPTVVLLATTDLQNITLFPSNKSEDENNDSGAKSNLAMTLAGIPRINRLKLTSPAKTPDTSESHQVHFERLKEDNPVPKDPKEAFLEEIRIQVASNASMEASNEQMMDEKDSEDKLGSERQRSEHKTQLDANNKVLHSSQEQSKSTKFDENALPGTRHPHADNKGHQASDNKTMTADSVMPHHHAGASVQKEASTVHTNEIKVTFTDGTFRGRSRQPSPSEESKKQANKSTAQRKPESGLAMENVTQTKQKTEKKQETFEKEAGSSEVYADDLTTTSTNDEREDQESGSEAFWSEDVSSNALPNNAKLGFQNSQEVKSVKDKDGNPEKPKTPIADGKKTRQDTAMQKTRLEDGASDGDESQRVLTMQTAKGQTMRAKDRRLNSEVIENPDMEGSGDEKGKVKPHYLLAKNQEREKKEKDISKSQGSLSGQRNQAVPITKVKLQGIKSKNDVQVQTHGRKEEELGKEEDITPLSLTSERNESKLAVHVKNAGKIAPVAKKNITNLVPRIDVTVREKVSGEKAFVSEPEEEEQESGLYSLENNHLDESRNKMQGEKQDDDVLKKRSQEDTKFSSKEVFNNAGYSNSFDVASRLPSNRGGSHMEPDFPRDGKVGPYYENRLRKRTPVNLLPPSRVSHKKSVEPDLETQQRRSRIIFIKNGQAVSPSAFSAAANQKESSGKRSVSIATNSTQTPADSLASSNGSKQLSFQKAALSNASTLAPEGGLGQAQQQQLDKGTKEPSKVVEHIAEDALAVDPDSDGEAVKQQLESETAKDLEDMFVVADHKDEMQNNLGKSLSGPPQERVHLQEFDSANQDDVPSTEPAAAQSVLNEDSPLPPYKAISPERELERKVKQDSMAIGVHSQNGTSTQITSKEPEITAIYPLAQMAKPLSTDNLTHTNQGLTATATAQKDNEAGTLHEIMKRSLPSGMDFADDVKRDLTRPLWFSDDIPEINEATHVNAIERLIEGASDDDLKLESTGSDALVENENEDDPPIA